MIIKNSEDLFSFIINKCFEPYISSSDLSDVSYKKVGIVSCYTLIVYEIKIEMFIEFSVNHNVVVEIRYLDIKNNGLVEYKFYKKRYIDFKLKDIADYIDISKVKCFEHIIKRKRKIDKIREIINEYCKR